MYIVVGYYDDIYPMQLGIFDSLEDAEALRKKAYEQFNLVRIFHEGEEVK